MEQIAIGIHTCCQTAPWLLRVALPSACCLRGISVLHGTVSLHEDCNLIPRRRQLDVEQPDHRYTRGTTPFIDDDGLVFLLISLVWRKILDAFALIFQLPGFIVSWTTWNWWVHQSFTRSSDQRIIMLNHLILPFQLSLVFWIMPNWEKSMVGSNCNLCPKNRLSPNFWTLSDGIFVLLMQSQRWNLKSPWKE